MVAPSGFTWTRRKNGDVVITHHGRQASVLRGARTADFLDDVADDPDGAAAQELMARLTGNDKRGNERQWRR